MSKKTFRLKEATFTRQFSFVRESIDEEARTVQLSFSSEEPVLRWFGMEILDHSRDDSADLSRLNDGAALLFNHERNAHIGTVENARIDTKAKKGRATVRFGKGPLASEKFEDVKDGILTKVSVSYELDDTKAEVTSKKGAPDVIRFSGWLPLELSLVTIPADNSVGVGRSKTNQSRKMEENNNQTTGTAPAPAQPTLTKADIDRAVGADRERQNLIRETGQQHGVPIEDVNRFCKEGRTHDEFVRFTLESRYKATPIVNPPDPKVGLSPKEIRSYSLVRAIRALANGRNVDGLEAEASEAVAKRLGRAPEGFYVPSDISTRAIVPDFSQRKPGEMEGIAAGLTNLRQLFGRQQLAPQSRALVAGTDAAGGYTVATEVLGSSLIELLRNAMFIMDLGAINLTGLQGDIAIPTHTGAVTAAWVATEGGALTPSDQTFGQLALTPKRLGAATAFTKQLLAQSSIDIEAFVRMDIAETLAVAKDSAAINGTGASGQPTGILATSGIGTVTIGAAGNPDWDEIVEFETDVAAGNALKGSLAYLVTNAVRGAAKVKTKVSGDAGAGFIWDTREPATPLNGYRAEATEQMPANGILFGNFRDVIVADWEGLDIVVDPYSLSLNNQVRVVINLHTDIGIRHAASFSKNA